MKRNFAFAILCLAVLAMSANAGTIAFWQFNEQAPGSGMASGAPGAILDSSGNGHNGTAVGQEMLGDPAVLTPTRPVYDNPRPLPLGDPQASLLFHKGEYNETGLGVPPENVQDRVEVPVDPVWNLQCASGADYTFEAIVKMVAVPHEPPANPARRSGCIMNYGDRWNGPDDGIDGRGPAWIWRVEQNGVLPNNEPTAQFIIRDIPGAWKSTDGHTAVMDGQWHHLAVTVDSDGAGNVQVKMYQDYVLDGTGNFTGVQNMNVPVDGFYDGLWIADFLGRWDDQFVGNIDAIRISNVVLSVNEFLPVPEPSSIVLLVMGALALVAIRRVR